MINTPVCVMHKNGFDSDDRYDYLCFYDEDAREAVKIVNVHKQLINSVKLLLNEIDACDTHGVSNQGIIDKVRELIDSLDN